tara:strand:- start:293 stop:721 length:429 start_codon:yes stop_codon:yes gene_type:complete
MSWGTVINVTTTHLDSATDDPSQARVEIYNALLELQAVIDGRGAASGVASLDATSKIPVGQIPDTIQSSSGNALLLQPNTGRVTVQDIILLTPKSTSELEALTAFAGDVAYCSNGDGGNPCAAVYNGSNWKVISFGSTISSS